MRTYNQVHLEAWKGVHLMHEVECSWKMESLERTRELRAEHGVECTRDFRVECTSRWESSLSSAPREWRIVSSTAYRI